MLRDPNITTVVKSVIPVVQHNIMDHLAPLIRKNF